MMEQVVLDTDIGGDIDDAICLAYLLREPRCELLGITTVCGESERRASIADAICQAAGRNIPIVAGYDDTMQPIPVYPTPDGAAALRDWPHRRYERADAPAFLYRIITRHPHEVTLIGIGNMTNIARLFTEHPDAPGLLKALYVMNGYFGAERLADPYVNWNSWADPLASSIVFSARVPVHRVMPLEVTDTLTISPERKDELFDTGSELAKAVLAFGNAWLERSESLTLHDPLAAVAVFHPDICRFERGDVRVETEREDDMGGTTFTPCGNGSVEIARSVDRNLFYRILSATLHEA